MKPGTAVQLDWHTTAEGESILRSLLDLNTYIRKPFGFLEKPNLLPTIKEIGYKIFVYGKTGIGKTRTVARLAGTDQITTGYRDVAGINVTATYWPVRLIQSSRILLFRLEFWDVGEMALKKFEDRMLPSCKEDADAVLFLFSFADRISFEDVPKQMSTVLDADEKACPIIIGLRYDSHATTDVTTRDVRSFEQLQGLPIIRLNTTLPVDTRSMALRKADFNETAVALSMICEQLWRKDQALLGEDLSPV